MKAYIFPGQGAQFSGMGREMAQQSAKAKAYFDKANEVLGFDISQVMFEGSEEELRQTKVTQPAVFLHSVILALTAPDFKPEMVAGHSLGEFSALVAAGALGFEQGLKLVSQRALAMQKACELQPSTMAAVLGMADAQVEEICASITEEVVVPANYNSPGQLVISGSVKGIELVTEKLKAAGAKRVVALAVGGAFHSPLMEPARQELAQAIAATVFHAPVCPVYQNVNALPSTDTVQIQQLLIAQLTAPVRWTQTIEHMVKDGATAFIECGPGKVLQGLIGKIARDIPAFSLAY
jgi:[acyl-carrier-protein] S-malonyltransferase